MLIRDQHSVASREDDCCWGDVKTSLIATYADGAYRTIFSRHTG